MLAIRIVGLCLLAAISMSAAAQDALQRVPGELLIKEAEARAQNIKNEAARLVEETKKRGYAAADKLEADARGPIAKMAAKKAAEKLRQESDDKAAKINSEADKKASALIDEARKRADEKLK